MPPDQLTPAVQTTTPGSSVLARTALAEALEVGDLVVLVLAVGGDPASRSRPACSLNWVRLFWRDGQNRVIRR